MQQDTFPALLEEMPPNYELKPGEAATRKSLSHLFFSML